MKFTQYFTILIFVITAGCSSPKYFKFNPSSSNFKTDSVVYRAFDRLDTALLVKKDYQRLDSIFKDTKLNYVVTAGGIEAIFKTDTDINPEVLQSIELEFDKKIYEINSEYIALERLKDLEPSEDSNKAFTNSITALLLAFWPYTFFIAPIIALIALSKSNKVLNSESKPNLLSEQKARNAKILSTIALLGSISVFLYLLFFFSL